MASSQSGWVWYTNLDQGVQRHFAANRPSTRLSGGRLMSNRPIVACVSIALSRRFIEVRLSVDYARTVACTRPLVRQWRGGPLITEPGLDGAGRQTFPGPRNFPQWSWPAARAAVEAGKPARTSSSVPPAPEVPIFRSVVLARCAGRRRGGKTGTHRIIGTTSPRSAYFRIRENLRTPLALLLT